MDLCAEIHDNYVPYFANILSQIKQLHLKTFAKITFTNYCNMKIDVVSDNESITVIFSADMFRRFEMMKKKL